MRPGALSLLLLLCGSGSAMIPKGLQTLTFDTWGAATVTGSPPTLAAFVHAGQQGAASAAALHDILAKLADDVRNVRVVEVDCAAEAALCKNFHVRRYPYLAYFTEDTNTSGVESARPYQGKRTAEGLRQFIKKITTPAINEIESAPTVDIMVDEITAGGERAVFLMVQPPLPPHKPNTTRIEGPKEPLVEAFRLTAFRLRDRYGFANIRANSVRDVGGLADRLPPLPAGAVNATYVVRLGLGDKVLAPRLLSFTGARAVPYAFRSMAALAKERRGWGGGGGGGGPLPDPGADPVQAGLLAWAHRWRLPLVSLLPRNLTELAANPEGRLVAIAVLADEGGEGAAPGAAAANEALMRAVEAAANPWDTGLEDAVLDRLLFAKLRNGRANSAFLAQYGLDAGEGFGASALPTLVAFDAAAAGGGPPRIEWAAPGDVSGEEEVLQWCVLKPRAPWRAPRAPLKGPYSKTLSLSFSLSHARTHTHTHTTRQCPRSERRLTKVSGVSAEVKGKHKEAAIGAAGDAEVSKEAS
jgi:hypothetical protein